MRLFGLVDGLIDRRDRTSWLLPPFDRRLSGGVTGPFRITAAELYIATAARGTAATTGSLAAAAIPQ